MVRIVLPSVWTTGGKTVFEATGGPLYEIIKRFAADAPEYQRRLLGPNAEPHSYLNICVNDDLIPRQQRAGVTVEDGSTITVLSPMAGG